MTEKQRKAKERYAAKREQLIEYSRQYYKQNKKKILQREKAAYQKNRERVLARQKTYYQENRYEILERNRTYYLWNWEKKKAYMKKWNERNRDKVRAQQKIRDSRRLNSIITTRGTRLRVNGGYFRLLAPSEPIQPSCKWTPPWLEPNYYELLPEIQSPPHSIKTTRQ